MGQSSAFNNLFRIKKVTFVNLVAICVLRVPVGGGSHVLEKFCIELSVELHCISPQVDYLLHLYDDMCCCYCMFDSLRGS